MIEFIINFVLAIVLVVVLFLIVNATIKFIWRLYITRFCFEDDELCHLPIPPGTVGYPLIGETIEFIRKNDKFYKKRQNKYGNVYRTHVMGRPTIRVTGAHNLRTVLKSEHSYVSSQWPPSIRRVLGPCALSMMDEPNEHKDRKKLLMNLFVPDALNSYIPIVKQIINNYIDRWCQKGQIIGYTECRNLGFTIAMRCLAGFDCDDETEIEHLSVVFESMVKNMFSLPYEIPGFGLYKSLKAKKYLMKKIGENIEKTLNRPVDDNHTVSALDYLFRDEVSRDNTCESIVELMFAGHDTTSSVLTSCLMFLGRHPEHIEKIRDENSAVEFEGALTINNIQKYRYTYNVAREVLRLTPPVGAGYRRVLKSFELEGYRIPKGWTLAYGIRDTHQTAPVYTEPEQFDPKRWEKLPNYDRIVTDNIEDRYNFSPFGGGARFCLGQDFARLVIRLFLMEICDKCDWTLENPHADLKYIPVPRAVDNLPLFIKRR